MKTTYNRFGKYKMVGREDGIDISKIFTKIYIKNFFLRRKCKHCGKIKDTNVTYCNDCISPQWKMTCEQLKDYWNNDKIK